jgi:pentose-5-phosphate-3-epimerase
VPENGVTQKRWILSVHMMIVNHFEISVEASDAAMDVVVLLVEDYHVNDSLSLVIQ